MNPAPQPQQQAQGPRGTDERQQQADARRQRILAATRDYLGTARGQRQTGRRRPAGREQERDEQQQGPGDGPFEDDADGNE
jgi:hypothetical protein